MPRAALGVDWYKRGWVAVLLRDGSKPEVLASAKLSALLAHVPEAGCVGVDMPIGLPDRGRRTADLEARMFVGVRRSSVFHAPPSGVLKASSYAEANEIAPGLSDGAKISQQAWALLPNIKLVAEVAADDDRLIEVHPEVSFREMAGEDLAHAKTTWNGQTRRRELLAAEGIELPPQLDEAGHVPVVDILDAAAAAWSARRYLRGEVESFPRNAERGSDQVIWF